MSGPERGESGAENFYQRVYALVRQVPPGRVVTYGQVATLLGVPRAARAVGYALRALPPDSDVPWHRVINHQGRISPRLPADGPCIQRLWLEEEGIGFDALGCVDLSRYGWEGSGDLEGIIAPECRRPPSSPVSTTRRYSRRRS